MLKKELRKNYLQKRELISTQDLEDLSLKIANNLLELSIWSYDYYHIYLPISSKKEIETSYILSILQGKDKNVIVPKITSDTNLTNILLTDNTKLKVNNWGVPEPVEGIEIKEGKIQVVFIPLLTFDLNGNRVGYGKGFYDSFLAKCSTNVVKIGLSLFEAEKEISDVNKFDIPLNYCVTPKKTYYF